MTGSEDGGDMHAEEKLEVALKDKIRNGEVWSRTTMPRGLVHDIAISMMRWYGHVFMKSDEDVVTRAWRQPVRGWWNRGW